MKTFPFIDLTRVDTDESPGGIVWVNALAIRDHCQYMEPRQDGSQASMALVFPGAGGMTVKDSLEEIKAKVEEALGEGKQDG